MRTGRSYSSTNGSSRVRIPLWPSSNNFQVFSASVASAVVMAMPVTTTLGKPSPVTSSVMAACYSERSFRASVAPEGERDIVAAESERVVDRVLVFAVAGFARNNIEVDLWIRGFVVQCRRDDAVPKGQHREDRFQRADRADGVAQRRLRRVDRGVLATGDPDGVGLRGVADRRGRSRAR